MQDLYPNPVDRFWAQVDKSGECWTWTGYLTKKGYGSITWGKRQRPAHRVSWMIHFGEIPEGLVVRHRCDNPPCVRPDHLELGTVGDNVGDMWERGNPVIPALRGGQHPRAKLTDEQVAEIKRLRASGVTAPAIAEQFGVSKWTVYKIGEGTRWKHVT